jgi:hypothetical protein
MWTAGIGVGVGGGVGVGIGVAVAVGVALGDGVRVGPMKGRLLAVLQAIARMPSDRPRTSSLIFMTMSTYNLRESECQCLSIFDPNL